MPDQEIMGSVSEFPLALSAPQFKLLLALSASISALSPQFKSTKQVFVPFVLSLAFFLMLCGFENTVCHVLYPSWLSLFLIPCFLNCLLKHRQLS